jgi:hypothetical protein
MIRRPVVLLVASAALAACGSPPKASTPPPPPADRCAAELPPSLAPDAPRPVPPIDLPLSTIVVHVDVGLDKVARELEAKVPRRVAEEKDHDIGVAGRLEYTADRGPLAVTAQGDALAVETRVTVRARACAKGRCYAGCEPEARVVAKVPLRVDARYRLGPSSVAIDVTRGCELRALGGFAKVDVTPILSARLAQEKRRIEESIDRELPDLTPIATRLWGELSQPQKLPLGACAVVSPEAIVQGPASSGPGVAHLAFGLVARPEIRVRCGDAQPTAKPLPPLGSAPLLPPDGDVHLAFVLPPSAAETALANAPLDLAGARAFVKTAKGDATRGFLLGVRGEACAEIRTYASGAEWKDDAAIHLAGASVAEADATRLDAAGVSRGVEAAAIPLPMAVHDLVHALPDLVMGLSDPRASLTARVTDGQPERAGLRGPDLVAIAKLRGSVTILPR